MEQLNTTDLIHIKTTKEKLWKALTESEYTVQYMYGCDVECSWNIGDPMLWRGNEDKIVYVKGYLLDLEKYKYLRYSVIDPNATYPDVPENYLEVHYRLEEMDNGVNLYVTQGDYNSVADGAMRYQHSVDSGGFAPVLEQIKSLLE